MIAYPSIPVCFGDMYEMVALDPLAVTPTYLVTVRCKRLISFESKLHLLVDEHLCIHCAIIGQIA